MSTKPKQITNAQRLTEMIACVVLGIVLTLAWVNI